MSPIRAETVGSFLRPDYLLSSRKDFAEGKITETALRSAEDKAIREVVAMQEEVGLDVVTDGEFRRENWWIDFVARFRGVEISTRISSGPRASVVGEIRRASWGSSPSERIMMPRSLVTVST